LYFEFTEWFLSNPTICKGSIPSSSTFTRCWGKYFPALRNRPLSSCACDVCEKFRTKLKGNVTPIERMKLESAFKEHQAIAKAARDFYMEMPTRCLREGMLHISIDAAESIQLPHFPRRPRSIFFKSRPQLHLYGIINDLSNERNAFFYMRT
jgi:hypothetical protein